MIKSLLAWFILSAVALIVGSSTVAAQEELELIIEGSQVGAEPIAIVPFGWTGVPGPTDVAAVIAGDLARTGEFKPVAREDLPSLPTEASRVVFRDWQLLGPSSLVIGSVELGASGKYVVQYRLFDVFAAKQVLGFQFEVAGNKLRGIAHEISDQIYTHLTGKPGAFNTRIAYVTETVGAGNVARFALNIADSDGINPREALSSSQPILSPAWSPDGTQLAYVSYENKQAQVIVQNIGTGKRRLVASFPGLNGAPAWSPDGQQLALTLSKDGNPEIYTLDLGTNLFRRITRNVGIDTEPSWSPDGRTLLFTSDRSGRPQIYQIASIGGKATRLTFEGKYNARASYSPDGSKIVMVHSATKGFQIALLDLVNQSLTTLTDPGLDESPSFAPNGSMILYATSGSRGAALAAVSVDGQIKQRLQVAKGGVREPAWSPFRKK